jgi:hypothetical protein
VRLAVAAGLNVTPILQFPPGATTPHEVRAKSAALAPVNVSSDTCSVALPQLVTTTVCVLVEPLTVFGKLTLLGERQTAGCPGGGGEAGEGRPCLEGKLFPAQMGKESLQSMFLFVSPCQWGRTLPALCPSLHQRDRTHFWRDKRKHCRTAGSRIAPGWILTCWMEFYRSPPHSAIAASLIRYSAS